MDVEFLSKVNYCCCCLNDTDEMLSIEEHLDDTFKISEAIFICIGIQYDDKNTEEIIEVTKNICTNCLNDLKQSLNFRFKCESSYQFMKQQIDLHSIESSIAEIEEITETNNYLSDNAKCFIGNKEKCKKCKKTFSSEKDLENHMNQHLRSLTVHVQMILCKTNYQFDFLFHFLQVFV